MAMIREMDAAKRLRREQAAVKARGGSNEVRKMLEKMELEIARELVDAAPGYWIEEAGPRAGDGRQKYRVFDPNGSFSPCAGASRLQRRPHSSTP
jgi:hypothetical protein